MVLPNKIVGQLETAPQYCLYITNSQFRQIPTTETK